MKTGAAVNFSHVNTAELIKEISKRGFDCEIYNDFRFDWINMKYVRDISCVIFLIPGGCSS